MDYPVIQQLETFQSDSNADAAESIITTWQETNHPVLSFVSQNPNITGFLNFIAKNSPYLTRLLAHHPDIFITFLEGNAETFCQNSIADITARQIHDTPISEGQHYLRLMKQRVALMIALADLSELWPLEQVTDTLSDFADACIQYALEQAYRHAIPKQHLIPDAPISPDKGIAVLGMGKLGGRELNYSSDIDLIALFDPEKLDFLSPPARTRFAVRLIKQVTSYLHDRQELGYVFRVDLRLRPDPASTGLAVSLHAAISYYERVGQNWERAAMIKARPVAGDASVSERFLSEIQKFIWRSHLDFAAIDDILSIKRQMQAKEEPEITLSGHHLKTGYGGIREIEFLAQIHQLIWGGRLPVLRVAPTCEVLHILANLEMIDQEIHQHLQQAYRLYRLMEHRLQMRQDQQTHSLPDSQEELQHLAIFCRADSIDGFLQHVLVMLQTTHEIFTSAFQESAPLGHLGKLVFTGVDHDRETLVTLSQMGFQHPADVSLTIQQWHKGTKRCTRTKRARELLTELVPMILEELADTVNPDMAFKRFDHFLDSLPVGVQPFSLFRSNSDLLALIADITGNAPVLAHTLSLYPQLLDQLVGYHATHFTAQPGSIRRELKQWLALARDDEEAVKNLCMFKLEKEFLTGVRLLMRDISAHSASSYLSRLADAIVHEAITLVMNQLEEKYAMRPDLHFAVIGLGKLGTQELMIGSDLDVMFVYDIPEDGSISESDAIALTQYYNRLTARVINLLGHPVKIGALYEMDTKLRPYGSQGALAVRLDGFQEYYSTSSWLVENLALLQGRIIYASPLIRSEVMDALQDAKKLRAPATEICSNILETREKISQQHRNISTWDIKYSWGGMMDVQWILKGLIGTFSERHTMPHSLNKTSEHIHWLLEIGAIDENQQQLLLEAHGLYHVALSYLRLCHGDALREDHITDGLKQLLSEVTGMENAETLQMHLLRLQDQVHHMFQNLTYM